MKQINKYSSKAMQIFFAICLFGLLPACQEEEYHFYSGEEYLQFGPEIQYQYRENYEYRDTLKTYTFAYESSEVVQDTIFFDLYTVGGPKDYDRPFKLVQVEIPDTVNCEAGKHYIAFDDAQIADEYVVKAGVAHMLIPIVFLRHESLEENVYVMKISIQENEHFKIGDPNFVWRKISVSDQLVKPNMWNPTFEKHYFGKYSRVKHRFLIETTGQKWDDEFITEAATDMTAIQYWQAVGAREIAAYNKEHPDDPLRDEDGELISMP